MDMMSPQDVECAGNESKTWPISDVSPDSSPMSKHRLSPAPLPIAKRQHSLNPASERRTVISFDSALYDELLLLIFSFLDSRDLCAVEAANRNCSRLAIDNHVCLL